MLMGAEELQNWVAYSALQDEKYRDSINQKINLEHQEKMSQKERTAQLRALLNGFK